MHIYLKKQNSEDYSIIQKNVNLSGAKLISLLWSIPEPHHKNLFHRDKADVTLSQQDASIKLNEKAASMKEDGAVAVDFKKIKHSKLHRHLGLTLKGEQAEGKITWTDAFIDEHEFLKYRDPMNWVDFFAKIQRAQFRTQSQAQLNVPKSDDSTQDEHDPRARTIQRQLSLGLKKENEAQPQKSSVDGLKYGFNLFIKHPLVHGLAVAGIAAAGLSLAGIGALITAGVSIGLGLLTYGVEYFIHWRQDKFESAYQEITQLKPSEVQELSNSYKSAFIAGLEADHWGGWTKSVVDTNAWKEYRAFGAGLKTSEHHDEQLKQAFAKP